MTESTGAKGGKVRGFFRRIGGFIKRHKVLTVIVVILLIIGIFVYNIYSSIRKAAESLTSMPQTLTLEKMDLEQIVAGEGTVQSATARQVGTSLTSKITHVYVEEGDYVNTGTLLCQLDTTDIDKSIADAQKEIAKAQATDKINLQAAQRRLNDAVTQLSVDETTQNRKVQEAGDAINNARAAAGVAAGNAAMEAAANADATGKTINEKAAVDAAQLALVTAQNDLTSAQATLALAQAEYESALASGDASLIQLKSDARAFAQNEIDKQPDGWQQLYKNAADAVTAAQTAYDVAYKAAYESFKSNNQHVYTDAYNNAYNSANVTALQSAYDMAVDSRESVLRNDNTSIASAREALATQKLVDSAATQKTQLEKYEKEKEESTITAPVSGTIVEITAEVGLSPASAAAANATSTASTGATASLFTIKDEGSLEIVVSVPEYDAVTLSVGLPVTITSDAISGQEWRGTVVNISPAATDANSNFTVTIQVTTAVEKLAIGMSAKVNIITDAKTGVFAVPYDAVSTDASGQSVVYALDVASPQGQPGSGSMPAGTQGMPAGGAAPSGDAATAAPQGRPIPVQTGMETDYYIEISGEGLSEGMTLLADPEGKNVNTANNFGFMMGPGGGF